MYLALAEVAAEGLALDLLVADIAAVAAVAVQADQL